jgi:F0F1-type ATP synthase assembly protein I
MIGFIGAAVQFAADFLSNIINGIVTKWIEMRESRKRGEAEAKNAAHEENAKRKARSDEITASPVKTGDELIAGLRDRSNPDD